MAVQKVVMYGASGYTGQLIAEALIRGQIPFIAAGRSRKTLAAAMSKLPHLGPVDVEIAEVGHERAALRELFANASVVINVVGPFWQLGRPVVEAALESGCHYLDTTGEPDWVRLLQAEFGRAFAERDRLLCPACAWMWTGGQLAAELCLETPGIDSLELLYAPAGGATIASTLSFLRMVTKEQLFLANRKLEPWPAAASLQVVSPHTHEVLTGLPWGGGCEPVWYANDPRVRNCRVMVAFRSNPGVNWVVQRMQAYLEEARRKSPAELEALTNEWAMSIAATPPWEEVEINRCTVSCKARGTLVGRDLTIHATSPYLQTSVLQAQAARSLLAGEHRAAGFASPAQAFGARTLIDALVAEGLHCSVS